jgi:2-oxoglutarate dehydrogenase E1 component
MCAENNMTVSRPSTPASYFHLLRRQGRDSVEKPLVVMTPKSLLRHPRCQSSLAALAEGRFEEVIDDAGVDPAQVRRVVLTTGKLFYDLLKAREDNHVGDVALVRLEQLYPFPLDGLAVALARYPEGAELVWAQEEPMNMGAWRFVREEFMDRAGTLFNQRVPRYLGREASASPAPGSLKVHIAEQEAIVEAALRVPAAAETRIATQEHAAPATS